jgi:hypothetical protein
VSVEPAGSKGVGSATPDSSSPLGAAQRDRLYLGKTLADQLPSEYFRNFGPDCFSLDPISQQKR